MIAVDAVQAVLGYTGILVVGYRGRSTSPWLWIEGAPP